jgi:hypothetical protein
MEPSTEATEATPEENDGADQPNQPRSRTAAVRERYARARVRVDKSAAGRVHRRWRELDIMNHGLILASVGLTLLVSLAQAGRRRDHGVECSRQLALVGRPAGGTRSGISGGLERTRSKPA